MAFQATYFSLCTFSFCNLAKGVNLTKFSTLFYDL